MGGACRPDAGHTPHRSGDALRLCVTLWDGPTSSLKIPEEGRAMDMNKWLIEFAGSRERLWKTPFDRLSFPEQVFVCVWELEAEVNNGGFDQYFFNVAGDNAHAVLAALDAIDAMRAREIAADAIAVFGPAGPPRDRDERQEILARFTEVQTERLDELGQAFLRYPDDLTSLLYAYVQQHESDFHSSSSSSHQS